MASISELPNTFAWFGDGEQDCLECTVRCASPFCDLPLAALVDLRAIQTRENYVGGEVLFAEGDDPRGVFILCKGRVKICIGNADGGSLVLRVAEPGSVLGLISTILDKPYDVTATAIWPARAVFIGREQLLNYLNTHPQAWLGVGRQLSQYCDTAFRRIRALALPGNALVKLAHLLIEWSTAADGSLLRQTFLPPVWTQEEIGRVIGVSRETVSRLLGQLRRDGVAEIKNSVIYINDAAALKLLAGA